MKFVLKEDQIYIFFLNEADGIGKAILYTKLMQL